MRNQFLPCLIAITLLFSCGDDDTGPRKTIELGATLTAEMGADLSNRVYIDLSTGTMSTVSVNTWELAFEKNGNAIRTNTAKKVAVATPSETSFDDVTSDAGLVYAYDTEDGNLNTTALAGWETNRPYIIDLGVDENGNALGKKKIMITTSSTTNVSIQTADLDGTNAATNNISLDAGNFTYFSLISEQKVTVEPGSWDFVLTGTSVRTGAPCVALGGGAQPGINCDIYRLAASALINAYDGVQVAKDDPFHNLEQNDEPDSEKNQKTIASSNFEKLGLTDFNTIGASANANAIGRSWLQILQPHRNGIYKVYDFITYIVKDQDGNYYKLRFLAYKGGDNAENGNPTFEYELITE
ncbi:HmuY family protein [Fulvivirgaceae bacterium BMA10]|uniref:HmuY family protein n=1 Tax=Splendidivirga corallicola TaxID=3051826 RepID=A0ABT8KPV3_9BACT|nr:HmuY family protein [Fulvivirgaceae bacterium BMA10]